MTQLKTTIHKSIHEIGKDAWNNLNLNSLNNESIFTSFEYLSALEDTNCVGANSGWQIAHLSLTDKDKIVGVIPLYVKYHSMGEYVFDHSWAQAYEQAGGHYYPKLLSAAPFTPVNGNRLLGQSNEIRQLLVQSLIQVCNLNNLSSVHLNFVNDDDLAILEDSELLTRIDTQYWWLNNNYNSFDDFLADMTSAKRKTIKRERRDVLSQVEFKTFVGNEITEQHLDFLYQFVKDTYDRKWGKPYLTRKFFSKLLESIPNTMVLFIAYQDTKPVAGAINFWSDNILYGRQWGCLVDIPFLHFEACYYQAIEFAIKNKIPKVEAGTQGEHKISRGYRPHIVSSSHYIRDENFKNAIANFLLEETKAMNDVMINLTEKLPFK